jgi:hypothetical protein
MTTTPIASEELRRRITTLRDVIAAAERKRAGIDAAISSRTKTLRRLLAQLATSECGVAYNYDE